MQIGPTAVRILSGVRPLDRVFVWTSGMSIDGDGAPTCYAPNGSGLPTLDYLRNAGKPGDYYGLACTGSGTPFVQQRRDPAPGYFISTTALGDRSKAANDPRRYVDSTQVPYIAIPPELIALGARKGDLSMVVYGAAEVGAIAGDVGPRGHIGEGSIELARQLGAPGISPKHDRIEAGVSFVLFAGSGSSPGWPREVGEFSAKAAALFSIWGGRGRLVAV